jgi:hypothetical protein
MPFVHPQKLYFLVFHARWIEICFHDTLTLAHKAFGSKGEAG